MHILDRVRQDQVKARKERDQILSSILTLLLSEIVLIGKNDGNRITTDVEAVKVIKKFISNSNTTIEDMISKNQLDKDKYNALMAEIKVYELYVPKQMDEVAIHKAIDDYIKNGATNMGAIMQLLKSNFDGLYDGRLASGIAKQKLYAIA